MTTVVKFHKTGGPEVLSVENALVGKPKRGEARVRHTAIGLNYIDTYHRSGLYPLPLPTGVGLEGAGVVEALGAGVTHVKVGDRVAYAGGPPGAYAQERVMPANKLVKIPKGVSDEDAAAMMLKGLTVHMLIRRVYRVQKGETVVFHAAAGGVGLIACQWLKALGAKVIGTVGSDEKAKIAKAHGCQHTINYNKENFAERVREITKGRGVPVVYDSVGKDTFYGSLDCLQPRGLLTVFGNGSGPVSDVDVNVLAKGSFYLTRPSIMVYSAMRSDLEAGAKELFAMVKSGKIKIDINQRYALADAAQAHKDLEARKTTGSTILMP
ncbi:MAG: quinone oxidoreductase [Betaproteobacteria bacterium]|jgi:NADPH2:quinone reductase|nr:quinone oxidoreductase [Betaproteobacteria bacterium]MBT6184027.1 quinone oxidoreductase [Betaproteobacteria bacterium]MDC1433073.1 quinone oxidoreductase [Burkholderiales bacterium]